MIDYFQIALPILERQKQNGYHVRDLTRIIIDEHPHIKDSFEDVLAILSRKLLADTKKKSGSCVRRVKNKKTGTYRKGVYAIKQTRQQKSLQAPSVEPVNVATQFTGTGGEYAVLSELLFRGYNAGIMTVDEGIDIVASKDNKYHHIQVKTAYESNGSFTFSIKNKAFNQNNGAGVFYIFVCRLPKDNGYENTFIVLPSVTIQLYIHNKLLKPNSNSIHIGIKKEGSDFVLAAKENVGSFINAFNLIT